MGLNWRELSDRNGKTYWRTNTKDLSVMITQSGEGYRGVYEILVRRNSERDQKHRYVPGHAGGGRSCLAEAQSFVETTPAETLLAVAR